MASFKSSSDCSRPCPVMCSIPPEMGIPQLSSPALMLDHFTVKRFFSISSEFPFIHPHSSTSRTQLHHPPPSFWQVGLPSAPFPHCLSSRLHKCSYQWLLWYATDCISLTDSEVLHKAISVCQYFSYSGNPWRNTAASSNLTCAGQRGSIGSAGAAEPPSLPQPQALAADSRRTCCSQTAGPVLQSCSQPAPPSRHGEPDYSIPHTGLCSAPRGFCRPVPSSLRVPPNNTHLILQGTTASPGLESPSSLLSLPILSLLRM